MNAKPAGGIATNNVHFRYDSMAIWLHWITALLVVTQFALAEFWDFFPRPDKQLMIVAHMSFGILLILVLLIRISWRWIHGHGFKDTATGIFALASKAMHYAFYILLAVEVVLGIFVRWTDNHALSFFGLQIPSPFGDVSKATGSFVEEIHNINAWIIMILAAGHALMALFHHYILHDDVLLRMLPKRRDKVSGPSDTPSGRY